MAHDFRLEVSDSGEAAYLTLPGTAAKRSVARTVELAKLIDTHNGAEVIIDLDAENRVVGIEILLDDRED